VEHLLSERIKRVPESFIRKILKVSTQPDVISFAGGLPNADFFPVEAIKQASNSVLEADGKKVLQYAASEGDAELRNWIAKRYLEKQGLTIDADNILITNGSQQALDLIAKVLLNDDQIPCSFMTTHMANWIFQLQKKPVSTNSYQSKCCS